MPLMRLRKSLTPVLLVLFLASCSTMAPKSFDQALAVGYTTQTSALQTTTGLLQRGQITKGDATRVLAISDQAGQALDSAKNMRNSDMTQAQAQLTLATAILDQVVVYLNTKGK